MAKTISSILTIAGVAALGVVTAGVAIGVAGGFTIGASIAGLSTALGISSSLLVAGALAGANTLSNGGPKAPKAETTSSAIKTERPPRFSAYGRVKLFGAYILYETASDGTAVDVYAFHEGRIDAVEGWYLGDKPVTRLANGFVARGEDGAYGANDVIQIGANVGADIETAHAPVVAKLPSIWTADHRGDGVVTGYMLSKPVKAKYFQEVYPSGGPNQTPLAIVIRAQPVFDWRDPTQSLADPLTWKWSENAWLHIVHYEMVRNGKSWERHFAPTLDLWTDAVNDADSAVPLKGNSRVAIGANAGAATLLLDNAAAFSVGTTLTIFIAPNFARSERKTITAIDGNLVDFDSGFSRAVPANSLAAGTGGTEPRYRSCVSHRHAGDGSEHKAVLAALLSCCDGWMAPRQDGALVPRAGRYYPPTVSIGPDVIAAYSIEDGVEDESAVNQIGVTYVSSAHDYNTVDTDPWTDEGDILTRGAVRSDDLSNQVPSHAQARRLAKRRLAQAMAPKRGTFVTISAGEAMLGERYVHLLLAEGVGTEDEFVAYDGPVEITQLSRNLQTGAVSASWIAADPNIDAWNPATEEGEPAPTGDRIAREPLEQPMIISATADFSAVGQNPEGEDEAGAPVDGTVSTGARVLIAANGPDREDLTWYGRWRVGAAGSWNEREYADADPGPGVSFLTEFVPLAENINVEVAYTSGDGRLSPWSDPAVVDTRAA